MDERSKNTRDKLKDVAISQGEKGIRSFVLMTFDSEGKVDISAEGNAMEIAFISASFDLFLDRMISGELK